MYIMKPLSKPYKYVYVNVAIMMSLYGDTKITLVLLPLKVVRLCWVLWTQRIFKNYDTNQLMFLAIQVP